MREARDHEVRCVPYALAALCLGLTNHVQDDPGRPHMLLLLTLAFTFLALALALPRVRARGARAEGLLVATLVLGLTVELALFFTKAPGMYLVRPDMLRFQVGVVVATVLVGLLAGARGRILRALTFVLVGVFVSLGIWLVKASPNPHIDVFVFHRDALDALVHGKNPFAMTFPNIYANDGFYGAGVVQHGRIVFGFPYPPLSLLLALPGHLLHDYRFSLVAAMALAAWLLASLGTGRVGALAAALYLFTGRAFFVLEQGWTEPLVVLALAFTVFAAVKRPRWLPYAVGLLLASKQYMVLAAPLALLLVPAPWTLRSVARFFAKAALSATLVTLPFALVDVHAFVRDLVVLHLAQPYRADSIGYLPWLSGKNPPHFWLALPVTLAAIGLSLWRLPRTPSGFAAGTALTVAAFVAFNKQAFTNYYFFVAGALACAIASSAARPGREPRAQG